MAGSKKGRRFAPGSGKQFAPGPDPRRNMAGRPRTDVRMVEIKAEIRDAMAELYLKFFSAKAVDVMAYAKDPDRTLGESIAMRALVELANNPDVARLESFLETIGFKEKQSASMNLKIESPERQSVKELSNEELAEKARLLLNEPNKEGQANDRGESVEVEFIRRDTSE